MVAEQRRAAREKFNARMSPEDAAAADTLAAEVNADGDVGDVSGLEDEDEAPGDVDGSDDDDTDIYDNEDADSRAADEALSHAGTRQHGVDIRDVGPV